MKFSTALSTTSSLLAGLLLLSESVKAHSYITGVTLDGKSYGREITRNENGDPVRGSNLYVPALGCGVNSSPAQASGQVSAGGQVDVQHLRWWIHDHDGHAQAFMAKCNGDCADQDPLQAQWFAIDRWGFQNGEWGTKHMVLSHLQYKGEGAQVQYDAPVYSFKVPSDLRAGDYLIRIELGGYHTVQNGNSNGAELYPACIQVQVTGGGNASPATGSLSDWYTPSTPGLQVNQDSGSDSYVAPGPSEVYSGGGSSGSSPAPSSSAATPVSSASPAPSSSAAPSSSPSPSGNSQESYSSPAQPAPTSGSNEPAAGGNDTGADGDCVATYQACAEKWQTGGGGAWDCGTKFKQCQGIAKRRRAMNVHRRSWALGASSSHA